MRQAFIIPQLIVPDPALSRLYQPPPGILHLANVYYKTVFHFRTLRMNDFFSRWHSLGSSKKYFSENKRQMCGRRDEGGGAILQKEIAKLVLVEGS